MAVEPRNYDPANRTLAPMHHWEQNRLKIIVIQCPKLEDWKWRQNRADVFLAHCTTRKQVQSHLEPSNLLAPRMCERCIWSDENYQRQPPRMLLELACRKYTMFWIFCSLWSGDQLLMKNYRLLTTYENTKDERQTQRNDIRKAATRKADIDSDCITSMYILVSRQWWRWRTITSKMIDFFPKRYCFMSKVIGIIRKCGTHNSNMRSGL